MKRNESGLDRAIRLVLAAVFFVAAFAFVGPSSILGIILIVLGAVMLLTAAIGFCPLYRLVGVNTCKVR